MNTPTRAVNRLYIKPQSKESTESVFVLQLDEPSSVIPVNSNNSLTNQLSESRKFIKYIGGVRSTLPVSDMIPTYNVVVTKVTTSLTKDTSPINHIAHDIANYVINQATAQVMQKQQEPQKKADRLLNVLYVLLSKGPQKKHNPIYINVFIEQANNDIVEYFIKIIQAIQKQKKQTKQINLSNLKFEALCSMLKDSIHRLHVDGKIKITTPELIDACVELYTKIETTTVERVPDEIIMDQLEQIVNDLKKNKPTCKLRPLFIEGLIGSGKSTTSHTFLRKFTISLLDAISNKKLASSRPIGVLAESDSSDQTYTSILSMLMNHPDIRDCILIFTSTGHNRQYKEGDVIINLAGITPNNIFCCLHASISRTYHPTLGSNHDPLNGLLQSIEKGQDVEKKVTFDTNEMNLTEIINYIWNICNKDQSLIKGYFNKLHQSFIFSTKNGNTFLKTCYKQGNQKFNAIWGVENRNCWFILDKASNTWGYVKEGLPAGAELGNVLSHSKLNQMQHTLNECIKNGTQLPSKYFKLILSMKVDGSLMQTTFVPRKHPKFKIMYDTIMTSENLFVKMLTHYSFIMSKGEVYQ